MRILTQLIFFTLTLHFYGQVNCEVFKLEGNQVKYNACIAAKEAGKHYQFAKEYQEIKDKALAIDSTYHNAYWAKSIAYLKSGDFLTWKKLIDKAVKLSPKTHLGYRGWCRYQFFRDYKGAIADIEEFERIIKGNIGYCQNGDYHLIIAKAICYKAIGEKDKAIQIITDYILKNNKEGDLYNYYHLGVLYYETKNYEKAKSSFLNQIETNDLAENRYYLSLTYKSLKEIENYKKELSKALKKYKEGYKMKEAYTHHYDKVFLKDIESELEVSQSL